MGRIFVYKSRLRQLNQQRVPPLTQEQIATKIKVTRQTVIRWMSDETFVKPDMQIASDLAILYGLNSPYDILEAIETKAKSKPKKIDQQAPMPQLA
jgi:transcriptional regulator with XRE-family HTH domain